MKKLTFTRNIILFLTVIINIVLFYNTMLLSVKTSLEIIVNTVLCIIFPYIILSEILCCMPLYEFIPKFIRNIHCKIFICSEKTIIAFIMGNICGYPIGAKLLSNLYKNNEISKIEFENMLAYCTNSSPAFVLGTIGVVLVGDIKIGICVYAIEIVSSILCAIIAEKKKKISMYGLSNTANKPFSKIISDSTVAAIMISGTIIVFNLILTMAKNIIVSIGLPQNISQALYYTLACVLEITNGVMSLKNMKFGMLQLVIITLTNCWSGLSVMMQVKMTVCESNISLKPYLIRKFVQMLIGGILIFAIVIFAKK